MSDGASERARHVAIITDGNGRWAQRRGLPVLAGHEAGADVVKARLRDAAEFGVRELTVYSFSTENWSRPPEEVNGLMAMFAARIDRETPELDEEGVRDRAGRAYDRASDPAGVARQFAAILTTADRTERLREVQLPVLVIHGAEDPLIDVSGGRATASAIPGSRLEVIEGMGHDLPPALIPRIVDLIAGHTAALSR